MTEISLLSYQGATWCKVLDASGKDPAKRYGLKTTSKRQFDKETRGYVWKVVSSRICSRDGLELVHKALVLQMCVGKQFSIEILVRDTNGHRRRILLSTAFAAVSKSPLHAQFPLVLQDFRGSWINWCLDLEALTQNAFGVDFHALYSFAIGQNCTLRNVFTVRDAFFTQVPDCFALSLSGVKKVTFPPSPSDNHLQVKGRRRVPSSNKQHVDPPSPPASNVVHIAFGSRCDKILPPPSGEMSSEVDVKIRTTASPEASLEFSRGSREYTTPEMLVPLEDQTEHDTRESRVDYMSFAKKNLVDETPPPPPSYAANCLEHLFSDIKILDEKETPFAEGDTMVPLEESIQHVESKRLELSPLKETQSSCESHTDDSAGTPTPPDPSQNHVELFQFEKHSDEVESETCPENSDDMAQLSDEHECHASPVEPEPEIDCVVKDASPLREQESELRTSEEEATQSSPAVFISVPPARDIELLPAVVEEEESDFEPSKTVSNVKTGEESLATGASFPSFKFQEFSHREVKTVAENGDCDNHSTILSPTFDLSRRTEGSFHYDTSVLLESATVRHRLSLESSSTKHRLSPLASGEEDDSHFSQDLTSRKTTIAQVEKSPLVIDEYSNAKATHPGGYPQRMATSNDISENLHSRRSGDAGSLEKSSQRFNHTVVLTTRYGPRSSLNSMRDSLDPPPSYVSTMADSCFGRDSEPMLSRQHPGELEPSRCWLSTSMVSLPAALEDNTSLATPTTERMCVDKLQKQQVIMSCSMHSDVPEYEADTNEDVALSDDDKDLPPCYDDAVSPSRRRLSIQGVRCAPASYCQSAPAAILSVQDRRLSISSSKVERSVETSSQYFAVPSLSSSSSVRAPGQKCFIDDDESRTSEVVEDSVVGSPLAEKATAVPLQESNSTNGARASLSAGVRAAKTLVRSMQRSDDRDHMLEFGRNSSSSHRGTTAVRASKTVDLAIFRSHENLVPQGAGPSPQARRTTAQKEDALKRSKSRQTLLVNEDLQGTPIRSAGSRIKLVAGSSQRHARDDKELSHESPGQMRFTDAAAATSSRNVDKTGCHEDGQRRTPFCGYDSSHAGSDGENITEMRKHGRDGIESTHVQDLESVVVAASSEKVRRPKSSSRSSAFPSPRRVDESSSTLLGRKLQELAAMEKSFCGEFGSLSTITLVLLGLLCSAMGITAFVPPVHHQCLRSSTLVAVRVSSRFDEEPVVSAVEQKEEEEDDEECEIDFETMLPVDPDKCM